MNEKLLWLKCVYFGGLYLIARHGIFLLIGKKRVWALVICVRHFGSLAELLTSNNQGIRHFGLGYCVSFCGTWNESTRRTFRKSWAQFHRAAKHKHLLSMKCLP